MSPLLLISFDNFARRKTSHRIKVKERKFDRSEVRSFDLPNEIYNRERLLSRGIDWMEMLLNFEHWWIYHPEWLPVTSTRIMKTQNALSPAARLESSNQKLLSQNSQSSPVFLELWEEKCWKIRLGPNINWGSKTFWLAKCPIRKDLWQGLLTNSK